MAELKEHNDHCKEIAEQLEAYRNGEYFEYNGNLYPVNGKNEYWLNNTNGNSYYLDDDGYYYYEIDGEKIDADSIEIVSLYDFFSDDSVYDVTYIVNSRKEFEAVRVMVACGGPNIYINTWDKQVELYWWNESGKYYLDTDICNAINEIFEELYNC